MFARLLACVTAVTAVVLTHSACGGIITYVKVTNDADSGISSSNTYTHALDFEQSGGVAVNGRTATINGVSFTSWSTNASGANFSRAVANGSLSNHNGAGIVSTSGNLLDLMTGFLYNNNPATNGTGLQTYTITGLTSGTTYDLRIYTHAWSVNGNRLNTLTFDVGGANDSTGVINEDQATTVGMPNNNDSYYINYRYTATGSSLVWTAANSSGSNASWHLYGLTNQVVPEPASLMLMGIGLSCMLLLPIGKNLKGQSARVK